MPGRIPRLTPPALWLALMMSAPLVATSCGPPASVPVPVPSPVTVSPSAGSDASSDPLDVIERHVAGAIARARESVLALEYTAADAPRGPRRMASGVVIGDGDVISVHIDPPPADSAPIVARDASGREVQAEWVAADPETGLTLLKILPGVARPVVPAQRTPTPGLPVLVIGNPFGLGHSVSRGAVAGLNRRLELGAHRLGGLIQVDTSLHPGDSGALLIDLRGGWLGVIRSGLALPDLTAADDRDRDRTPDRRPDRDPARDHDLGFAIPAADALWVAGQLRVHHRVDRAYLGIIPGAPATAASAGPVPPAAPVDPEPQGVALDQVLPDTPADHAGLKPGDRVVALDGQLILSAMDLDDRLARTAAGAEVAIVYLRGDGPARVRQTLAVHTAHRPPTDAPQPRPRPAPPDVAAVGKKEKDGKPRAARAPLPPDVAERIDRLERRIDELEAAKSPRDRNRGAGVARRP
jgi:serine protease Do